MNGNRPFPKGLLLGLVLALALTALGLIITRQAVQSRMNLPKISEVPAFSFTRSNGETFTKKDLNGRVTVVDFIFTNCGGVCPIMTSKMSELYRLFQGSDQIQFVSISVDPDNDTPEVLAAYALEHGITDSRWIFLTGPIEQVASLCEKGFLMPADDLPGSHSSRFVLVDQQGWIRGYYDGLGSMEVLAEHLRQMAKVKA